MSYSVGPSMKSWKIYTLLSFWSMYTILGNKMVQISQDAIDGPHCIFDSQPSWWTAFKNFSNPSVINIWLFYYIFSDFTTTTATASTTTTTACPITGNTFFRINLPMLTFCITIPQGQEPVFCFKNKILLNCRVFH